MKLKGLCLISTVALKQISVRQNDVPMGIELSISIVIKKWAVVLTTILLVFLGKIYKLYLPVFNG